MSADRVESLRRLLERNPRDPRPRLGLAMEYEKLGRWEDVVRELERYLENADDQGNAWGRLGSALRALGRDEAARAAYRRGIEAAGRHGHSGMVEEFEELLEDIENG
ncbi:MAG: hypothetical protein FIB01_16150 [Gemmatimonadetes bacterium]|nr:hypothetical protein [Gemmatimonadota bacterium]